MATTKPHGHEYAEVPGGGHEKTDLDLTGLFHLSVWSVLILVAVFGGMWLMFRMLERREAGLDPLQTPVSSRLPGRDRLPTGPQLQVDEPGDLATFRAAEDRILTTYEWLDRKQGTVRVPIDRAIEMLVARGVAPLGSAPATVAPPPGTVTPPTTSGAPAVVPPAAPSPQPAPKPPPQAQAHH
jgi:hypothetical protein